MVAANRTAQEVLAELREVIDQRDQLNAEDRRLSNRREALERELLEFHEATGLESLSGAGLSVSFDTDAMRAKYDPERWASIVRWAVESGRDYIIQRRLTDAKVLSLVQEGVALPDGLTLENYTKLSVRRK